MLSSDQGLALGCQKYRELYPKGVIPEDIEDEGVLNSSTSKSTVTVTCIFWFESELKPFILFNALVDRETSEVTVTHAEDWTVLKDKTFARGDHVT